MNTQHTSWITSTSICNSWCSSDTYNFNMYCGLKDHIFQAQLHIFLYDMARWNCSEQRKIAMYMSHTLYKPSWMKQCMHFGQSLKTFMTVDHFDVSISILWVETVYLYNKNHHMLKAVLSYWSWAIKIITCLNVDYWIQKRDRCITSGPCVRNTLSIWPESGNIV